MKIKFSTFVLAEQEPRALVPPPGVGSLTGPANLRINGQRIFQIAEFLRATEVRVFDRKNRRTTITFTATHRFSTIDEAQAFILDRLISLPNRAHLELTSSTALIVRYLPNAVLGQIESAHDGATAFFNYQFIGGQLTPTAP